MNRVFRGIRPLDVVVAGALVALAAFISLIQVGHGTGVIDGTRIDSDSVWQLPLWAAAPAAVLWWRRNAVAVVLFAVAVVLGHTLVFGWLVRCGSGLPLTFALAFYVGVSSSTRRATWLGLGGLVLLNAAVLVKDSAAGPSIMPFTALITLALFGVGRLVRSRIEMAQQLAQHNTELQALRDQRAALEVTGDRTRLSEKLDQLLDGHLTALAVAAEGADPRHDPVAARATLVALETQSRDTLRQMREIVGQLRGGELALAPAPSVARLDALLALHGGRVRVEGDPRRLPASVELSAYRIVEHLLSAIEPHSTAPVDVRMRFDETALEVTVSGAVQRGKDIRGAVARARERARLQDGSLSVKVSRGRARAVAQLPLLG